MFQMILDKRSKRLRIFGRLLSKVGYNVSHLKDVAFKLYHRKFIAGKHCLVTANSTRAFKLSFGKIVNLTCLAAFSFVSRSILK